MAYASRRKVAYRKKASRSTRRYSSRFAPRRSSAKKRTYRKKTSMSKRRILNTTSTKKRNGMLSWSNTTGSGAVQTTGLGSLNAIGGTGNNIGAITMFCPTAMDLNAAGSHTTTLESRRTATTCYMRGFSEHIRVQTSSGLPWFWRRICFTLKEDFQAALNSDTPTNTYRPYVETSNGLERLWLNQTINAMPNTIADQQNVIFKGVAGVDWNDLIVAPVDTRRVTLKSDVTRTIRSGNAAGTVREFKLWHPMNKNLVYDDDENGVSENSLYFSVASKAGMGDYFIYDIFLPGLGSTTTDIINVTANSTLYWHEK